MVNWDKIYSQAKGAAIENRTWRVMEAILEELEEIKELLKKTK